MCYVCECAVLCPLVRLTFEGVIDGTHDQKVRSELLRLFSSFTEFQLVLYKSSWQGNLFNLLASIAYAHHNQSETNILWPRRPTGYKTSDRYWIISLTFHTNRIAEGSIREQTSEAYQLQTCWNAYLTCLHLISHLSIKALADSRRRRGKGDSRLKGWFEIVQNSDHTHSSITTSTKFAYFFKTNHYLRF